MKKNKILTYERCCQYVKYDFFQFANSIAEYEYPWGRLLEGVQVIIVLKCCLMICIKADITEIRYGV